MRRHMQHLCRANYYLNERDILDIHVHIHNGEVKEGRAPRATASQSSDSPSPKKKRKASKYQREFGRQMKKLKRKHPRTAMKNLMKRAHSATKRALK